MIFENSLPKANFGQNIRDSPNGSLPPILDPYRQPLLIAKYQPKFGKDPSPFTSEGDAVEQCETIILAFKNSIKSLNLFLFRCLR